MRRRGPDADVGRQSRRRARRTAGHHGQRAAGDRPIRHIGLPRMADFARVLLAVDQVLGTDAFASTRPGVKDRRAGRRRRLGLRRHPGADHGTVGGYRQRPPEAAHPRQAAKDWPRHRRAWAAGWSGLHRRFGRSAGRSSRAAGRRRPRRFGASSSLRRSTKQILSPTSSTSPPRLPGEPGRNTVTMPWSVTTSRDRRTARTSPQVMTLVTLSDMSRGHLF